MRIVRSSFMIDPVMLDGMEILRHIERAGRTAYKSEDKITEDSAVEFVRRIIKLGHDSVLEHEKVTVRIVCDRGVSHELVRHRIASYTQESTRFCDYAKEGEVVYIFPTWLQGWDLPGAADVRREYDFFCEGCAENEHRYLAARKRGWPPEKARGFLGHFLKTEIVITANLREWRHIFRLRAINPKAHPQMREIMLPLLAEFRRLIPVVFDDL